MESMRLKVSLVLFLASCGVAYASEEYKFPSSIYPEYAKILCHEAGVPLEKILNGDKYAYIYVKGRLTDEQRTNLTRILEWSKKT